METDRPIKPDPFDLGRLRLPPGAYRVSSRRDDASRAIDRGRHSSRDRFLMPGYRRPPASRAPASTSQRPCGSSEADTAGPTDGASKTLPRDWASRSDRPNAASTRPRKPGWSASPGSRVANCPSRSWTSLGRDRSGAASAVRTDPLDLVILGLRVPGPSLSVAMVCWFVAGTERAAAFKLALGEWADFGLSRQAAGRGLDSLESAGLLSVTLRPGKSPVVIITDPPPPQPERGHALGNDIVRHNATELSLPQLSAVAALVSGLQRDRSRFCCAGCRSDHASPLALG